MDVASQMVTAFEAIHTRVTNISSNTHTHTHTKLVHSTFLHKLPPSPFQMTKNLRERAKVLPGHTHY